MNIATIGDALHLALQYHQGGNLAKAEPLYREVLRVDPHNFNALHMLGLLGHQMGRNDEAIALLRQALTLQTDFPAAHNNLGNALQAVGKIEEAIAGFREAIRLKPTYAKAHNNLGTALTELCLIDEGVASCQEAVRLQPDYAEAHYNLGNAVLEQGHLQEALTCYQRTLQILPDCAEAHLNIGIAKLLLGEWDNGWIEYEWRWKVKTATQPVFAQPSWKGEPYQDRTILLHTEQGLGDTLQFIRYAPMVKQRMGQVFVVAPTTLLPVLAACPGIDRLLPKGSTLPEFDVQASLMSLPGIFGTSVNSIPADIPYLVADAKSKNHWEQILFSYSGRKVGIAWQGSPAYQKDRKRSIPLQHFQPLAQVPNVHLFSLQVGPGREQITSVSGGFPVIDLGGQLNAQSFMDAAGLLMNLDLLVTCDTAIAHLAGALGVPVWVAIPFVPDWRWLLQGETTPWYPTMRLFRQPKRGDWNSVFEKISEELKIV